MRNRHAEPTCAICSVDPETGRAGTNATTRICQRCRADPANVDWVESQADRPARGPRTSSSVDVAIRDAVREAIRDVVREELRSAIRDELARAPVALSDRGVGDGDAYLSVGEAANIANVHEATIRSWITKGQLRGHRAGRHRRVKRSELEQFMSALSDGSEVDIEARAAALAAA
ncbi:MAG TPA: helix-turn-helix domain-containing protein [Polyangia bacterium]|jgi:excisionase family DNA binding protein